jgi:hypothetical protein
MQAWASSERDAARQLTARGETGAELLPKTTVAVKRLLERNCRSFRCNATGRANAIAPLCPTHGRPMKARKHGSGWDCPVEIAEDDGTGRPFDCKQRVR